MGTIHQVLTADEKKVIEAYRRMDEQQKKLVDRMRQMKTASRDTDNVAVKLSSTFKEVGSALGIAFGAGGAIMLARQALQGMREDAARLAQNVREAAQDMVAFAMMQERGTMRQRALRAAQVGATFGIQPGVALQMTQRLQAQLGGFPQGLRALRLVGLLRQAAVPTEAAAQAVILGAGLGYAPEQAAAMPFAAGMASALSPAEIAQGAVQALPSYQGVRGGALTAYQVMALLSSIYSQPEQLGTYTRIAARITRMPEVLRRIRIQARPGEKVDFWRVLEALRQRGITTQQELMTIGVREERMGAALSALLSMPEERIERVRRHVAEQAQRGVGLIREQLGVAYAELPEIELQHRVEREFARTRVLETMGDSTIRAMRGLYYRARLGRLLTERGYGFWPMVSGPPEKREIGLIGWLISALLGRAGPLSPEEVFGQQAAQPAPPPVLGPYDIFGGRPYQPNLPLPVVVKEDETRGGPAMSRTAGSE